MILFFAVEKSFKSSWLRIQAQKGEIILTCFVVFPFRLLHGWSRVSSISRFPVRERPTPDGIDSTRHTQPTGLYTHTHNENLFVFYFCIRNTHCVLWKVPFGERERERERGRRVQVGRHGKSVNDYIYTQKWKEFGCCCWKTSTVSLSYWNSFVHNKREGEKEKKKKKKKRFILNCLYSDDLLFVFLPFKRVTNVPRQGRSRASVGVYRVTDPKWNYRNGCHGQLPLWFPSKPFTSFSNPILFASLSACVSLFHRWKVKRKAFASYKTGGSV